MALTATHIRFALDLKDKYQAKNIPKYITGALYPDSHYKTRINRELTHPIDFQNWDPLTLGDFKKGWLTHLYCDKLQSNIVKKFFPEYFDHNPIGFATEAWIILTAIKLLQDQDDIKKFEITSNLPNVNYAEVHNNESLEDVKSYYNLLINVYSDKDEPDFDDYLASFKGLGLPSELGDRIILKAKELQQDKIALEKIYRIYDEMLNYYGENPELLNL